MLSSAWAGVDDERSRFLVDTLSRSAEIYGYYSAGDRGEMPGYYSNNFVREEYMKTRFLEEYRRAEAVDGARPRGLLKYGHWHLYKGLSPGRVPTLGNFLNGFARINELGFFSIAVYGFDDGSNYGPLGGSRWNAYLRPFAAVAGEDRWTLVDLRPFREYPTLEALDRAGGLDEEAKGDLRRLVYGFDSVLLLGGTRKATYETTGVDY